MSLRLFLYNNPTEGREMKISNFNIFLKKLGLSISLAGLLIITGISSVSAQTPDGQTPAEESVCDVVKGGTPGLYGLCVAYCEAQDLDGYDFNDPNTAQKAAPNRKILENYRKKMQPGDPDMPCLQVPCPCWDESDLLSVTAANILPGGSCSQNSNAFQSVIQTSILVPGVEGGFATVNFGQGGLFCFTRDLPPFALNVTQEEHDSCRAQIADRCAALGDPIP